MSEKTEIEEKTWEEFRETGLFAFVNAFLHIFGWCIIIVYGEDNTIHRIYPAKTNYRRFNENSMEKAYKSIDKFIKKDN
jgi:hypothetical protein